MYNLLEELNKVVSEKRTHNDFYGYYSSEEDSSKSFRARLCQSAQETEENMKEYDPTINEYAELYNNTSLKNINVDNLTLNTAETIQYLL